MQVTMSDRIIDLNNTDDEDAYTSGMSGSGDGGDLNVKPTLKDEVFSNLTTLDKAVKTGSDGHANLYVYITAATVACVIVILIIVLIIICSRKKARERKEKSLGDQSTQVTIKTKNKQGSINIHDDRRQIGVLAQDTMMQQSQTAASAGQNKETPSRARTKSKGVSITCPSRDKIQTGAANHCEITPKAQHYEQSDKIRGKNHKDKNITDKSNTNISDYKRNDNVYYYNNASFSDKEIDKERSPLAEQRKNLTEADVTTKGQDGGYVEVV